ncbi:MAG: hypothetical protein HY076_02230 [Candidatus Eisenbacteria bacterium]|uniref:Uncharacterized protein n=1 Tax=Eiseniibacteriota bacterium TaxID=2212470 RepID=A0A9D6L751_UNCEI|nr:hypothetical protein [Candidatus Eisenbacteria bacterium]MBI3539074.1 hypothetical protein [Candidatus Eisenbacteria bacterium]
MAWTTMLEKLDRRWIFAVMGLLVAVPLVFPAGLPLTVSAPARGFSDAIDAVPDGSTILMSCDYDPSARPEMVPMTRTAFRQLMRKNCRVVVTVLWNAGPALVDATLNDIAREFPQKKYGVDWVNLGYKAGDDAVMVLMGKGIANAFPRDYHGNETKSLPIMHNVRDYSSFPLLVNISAGFPGTKEWVQQVQSRFHLPMVSGCTAVSAPEYYPYLQSGQLKGLLGGMAGAAEYEKIRGENGTATRGMDAQSLAHVFVAFCIVLGNVVQWAKRREGTS